MMKNLDKYIKNVADSVVNDYKQGYQAATTPPGDDRLRELDAELGNLQAQVKKLREQVTNTLWYRHIGNNKGFAVVLCALCMPVLIAFVALTIDTGMLSNAVAKAQATADACALGMAAYLYSDEVPRPTQAKAGAPQVADTLALANHPGAQVIEATCGHWQSNIYTPREPGATPVFDDATPCDDIESDATWTNACRVEVAVPYISMLHGDRAMATRRAIAYIAVEDNTGGCDVLQGSRLVQ